MTTFSFDHSGNQSLHPHSRVEEISWKLLADLPFQKKKKKRNGHRGIRGLVIVAAAPHPPDQKNNNSTCHLKYPSLIWSAIAARLPGRTDNEIKNVWHTHLKKRLDQNHLAPKINGRSIDVSRFNHEFKTGPETMSSSNVVAVGCDQSQEHRQISPQRCSSDVSSMTTVETSNNTCAKIENSDDFHEMDEVFWSEVLSADNSSTISDLSAIGTEPQVQFPFYPLIIDVEQVHAANSNMSDSMDFWFNLFTRAGELPELPEI
ncbi:hypothetical protein SADUNF_Sadunf02G0031900 [Salix dunnii]|uniref:Uncharacterized protein n=1 Tax=Salix dunnii TaxID=1413687 RepID=A0A835N5U3_9ROSI|nr:hypothetical protein SADUNF_Sadunf02G0031900 [Salix dunnii]